MRTTLRLFGTPRVERGPGPFRGRAAQRRRLALLALLAITDSHRLSRDKLIALLWPDAGPEQARKLLSEAVYVIRKELGEGIIQSSGDDLILDSKAVDCDVIAFREQFRTGELGRGVELYTGPFFDGCFIDGAPELERVIDGERTSLARAYAAARRGLAEREQAAGNLTRAIEHWQALVLHDPLASASVLGYATALVRAGERAAALQAILSHQNLLATELGVEMATELSEFAARLKRPSIPRRPSALASGDARVEDRIASPVENTSANSLEVPPGQAPSPSPASRWRRFAAPALLVLLAVVGATRWVVGRSPAYAAGHDSTYDLNRLAVLYFDDHSLQQDLGPLADGITEELIHQLSGVNALQVVSRNGVRPYRGRPVGTDSIGRALRVGSIVEGSVQRSGRMFRVTTDFIDPRTGVSVESRTFERSEDELFQLEEALGLEIASALRRRIGREIHPRRIQSAAQSYRAAEYLLRGESQFEAADSILDACDSVSKAVGVAGLVRADSLLALAAAADRAWGLPWIDRGRTAARRASLEPDAQRQALYRRGLDFAEEAIRRDSADPRGRALRGSINWSLAKLAPSVLNDSAALARIEGDLEAAVAKDSTLADAWATLSAYYRARGHYPEAADAAKRAFATDAYLESAQRVLPQIISSEYENERPDSARAYCTRARMLMPTNWRFIECELTEMLYDPGVHPDVKHAWRLVEQLRHLNTKEHFTACGFEYATTYWPIVAATLEARVGNYPVARRVLANAEREVAARRDLRASFGPDEAYLLYLLGDRDSAAAIKRRDMTSSSILAHYYASDPRLRLIPLAIKEKKETP